jgi:pyrroloquinoline quinone biosynthesis protein B
MNLPTPRTGAPFHATALAFLFAALASAPIGCTATTTIDVPAASTAGPFTIVLGIAQDAGVPQAGVFSDPRWDDPAAQRLAVSLGIVDPASSTRYMIDATPDFKRQSLDLYRASDGPPRPVLDGILLTHGHMGHYTGLMFLGHESIGANGVPVWAMPRMAEFLRTNGPWSQLVAYGNIRLEPLTAGVPVELGDGLSVTPLLVPHRQEFSEVVAFRVDGPRRSVLWLPDIDSWREWDEWGVRLEDVLATVDVAYLDATFFADGEIPGRDMSGFPHPFIRTTIDRLADLPASERKKVRFIHLNHTNPALDPSSPARREIESAGMAVAERGEIVGL